MTIEEAIVLAANGHKGQKDKAGASYILHPLRLLTKMTTTDEMLAAVLHDIVEDTDYTLDDLKSLGCPDNVLEAINLVTNKDNEDYMEKMARIKTNSIARKVKLADLEDNMNIARLPAVTSKDINRLDKYILAMNYLKFV